MTDDLLTPDNLHLSRSKIEACEAVVASPNDWMRSDKPSGILVRVAGLEPSSPYVLALATSPSANGPLQPLAAFVTNPAGSAIVNTDGPIRQMVSAGANSERRYLVIAEGAPGRLGPVVQQQTLE